MRLGRACTTFECEAHPPEAAAMTFTLAFYLFILPLLVAAGGVAVAYSYGSDRNQLHPGE
jgi:hypothetical protein